jgi:hypothetical protein
MKNSIAFALGVTLLAGCAAPMLSGGSSELALSVRPQLNAGGYATQAEVSAYTRTDVAHVQVRLYQVDGQTETPVLVGGQPLQHDVAASDLGKTLRFGKLHPHTTYRLKAFAYEAPGFDAAALISHEASSSVDVTVHAASVQDLVTLPVQLKDRVFSGLARSGGFDVTPGVRIASGSTEMEAYLQVKTLNSSLKRGFPSLTSDAAGNIYWLWNNSIHRFSPAGIEASFPVSGLSPVSGSSYGDGEISSLARDDAGNFYVYISRSADRAIHKLSFDSGSGTYSAARWRETPNEQITDLKVLPGGSLLAVSSSAILKFKPTGEPDTAFGPVVGAFIQTPGEAFLNKSYLGGLAVDASGRIYVASSFVSAGSETKDGELYRVASDGKSFSTLITVPKATRAIALDSTGQYAFLVHGMVSNHNEHILSQVKLAAPTTIKTIAGVKGVLGRADGRADLATFYYPNALLVLPDDVLIVGDSNGLRKVF